MNPAVPSGPATPEHDTRFARRVLILGILLVFVWRVIFSYWVNLIPDECSYWAWSRHLDWSYFDNSGMVAYLIRLSTALFGNHTPFAVRVPFLILSAVTTYLVYRISVILFHDRLLGLLVALLLNLTPFALLGGSTAVHDNALIFCWVATLWAAAKFITGNNPRWFYCMGLFTALAILSKYTGVLILPALLLFLVWSPRHRSLLLTKEPWLGALVALIGVVPIVVWNIAHDWASLHHILFIGSGATSIVKKLGDGLAYHLAQFLLVSPLLYIALVVGLAVGVKDRFLHPDPRKALLACFAFPLFLFGLMAFKGHVEANWAFMGYPSAAILAVHELAERMRGGRTMFTPRYLRVAIAIAVVPVLIVVLHAWIGLVPASMEKKLGKADRIIWETRGWKGLGLHVHSLRKPGDVIAGDSYQMCASLEFNVPGNPFVRYVAPWSRPTQFDVWEPSFDNLKGKNILYVSSRPLVPSNDARSTIYQNFTRVESLPPYRVMYHGVPIRSVYVARGVGFNPSSPVKLGPRSLFYTGF